MTESHLTRTLDGLNWNLRRVLLQTATSFGVVIVLARIFQPSEFGVIALAMILISMAERFSSLGADSAVIQRFNIDESHWHTARTLAMIGGASTSMCMFWAAPYLAEFFDVPNLEYVAAAISCHFLLSSVVSVIRARLIRELNFQWLFWVDSVGHLVGYCIVTLILAFNEFGVWSVVFGSLSSWSISALILLFTQKNSFSLELNAEAVGWIYRYSRVYMLSGVANFIGENAAYFFIGKNLSQESVGLYNRAQHLVETPLGKSLGVLVPVMFSSYSEVQRDKERVAKIYVQQVTLSLLVMGPLFGLFVVDAEYVIIGLYGEHWSSAVAAFQVMSVTAVFGFVSGLTRPVMQALGWVGVEARIQVCYLLALVVSCAHTSSVSILAVSLSALVCVVFYNAILYFYVSRLLNIGFLWLFLGPGRVVSVVAIIVSFCFGIEEVFSSYFLPGFMELVSLLALQCLCIVVLYLYLPKRFLGAERGNLVQGLAGRLSQILPRAVCDFLVYRCSVIGCSRN